MKSPEKVIAHIVNWLNNYAEKSGMNGFVVGVSGGIDSASNLNAMCTHRKTCFTVSRNANSSAEQNQVSRAQEHIAWLRKKISQMYSQQFPVLDRRYLIAFKKLLTSHYESEESQFLSLGKYPSTPSHDNTCIISPP